MTDSRILPGARERLINPDGTTKPEFYRFFRLLQESGVSAEQIRELCIKLGSPDGTIANIPDKPGGIQSIIGQAPILAAGNTVSLASLAQTVGGELVGVTVDGFGRVSQTRPVVPGVGIEIDGTTDPTQIEIINDNPNVMTTLGDMIRADTGGVPERLPIGTNGQVLTVVSGEPNWATSTALTNPMTTLGDIITGGASGTPQRLGIGTAGQVLTVVSGAPAWAAASGGGSVNVQDEGTTVVTGATAINFVGAGVTATAAGSVATVTIPGAATPSPTPIWEGYATVIPQSNTTSDYGLATPLLTGSSSTARTSATTNRWTNLPRRAHNQSTPSTTAIAGIRSSSTGAQSWLLSSSTSGGCEIEMVVSPGTGATIASHRLFAGWWSNTAAPTDVDPSTLTNIVGLGYDSADTQVQIIHNDASGTATKVALGASFPKPTTVEGSAYYVRLSSTTAGTVDYFVREIIGGASTSGTITTDLPTALLNWYSWMSAGGTSTTLSHVWSYTRIKVFG